jgi:predicted HicB family RNase H-like nuclease
MTKSVRIDENAHKLSKIEAARAGVSQQEYISDLIRREVKARKLDPVKKN